MHPQLKRAQKATRKGKRLPRKLKKRAKRYDARFLFFSKFEPPEGAW